MPLFGKRRELRKPRWTQEQLDGDTKPEGMSDMHWEEMKAWRGFDKEANAAEAKELLRLWGEVHEGAMFLFRPEAIQKIEELATTAGSYLTATDHLDISGRYEPNAHDNKLLREWGVDPRICDVLNVLAARADDSTQGEGGAADQSSDRPAAHMG